MIHYSAQAVFITSKYMACESLMCICAGHASIEIDRGSDLNFLINLTQLSGIIALFRVVFLKLGSYLPTFSLI